MTDGRHRREHDRRLWTRKSGNRAGRDPQSVDISPTMGLKSIPVPGPEADVSGASTPEAPVEISDDEQRPGDRATLGNRAARGALQTVSAQALKILIQVGGVVVLARLLTPRDYGLVAMVAAIIAVAEIFRDFGLSSAAIQAKTLSRAQRDNLFWINSAAGLTLTVIVLLCAPMISIIYHHPELTPITQALSVIFFVNGLSTQYRADLNRHMRFGSLASIDIVAPLIALAAAISLAKAGAGSWALVAQQLIMAAASLLGVLLVCRWIPRPFRRAEPMGNLISFGWHLAGAQIVGYIGNNVDSIVIGTRFGPTALGLYNRAFQLLMTPLGQLRQPTTTVALPVLSNLRSDVDASNRFVARGQSALGWTLVAGLGFIIGAAGPVTEIFLGPQWLEVEPLIRLLAAAGAFQTLAFVGYWVYLAHGLTRQLLRYTFVTVAIKVICILVGSHWGVVGVACGYAIAPALSWPISFWWLSQNSPISVRPLMAGGSRLIVLAGLIAATTYAVCVGTQDLNVWIQLAAGAGIAVTTYACMACLPVFRGEFLGLVDVVRRGLT